MPSQQPNNVRITPSACAYIQAFIAENHFAPRIRIYAERGSCSGTRYGLSFEDYQNPDDTVLQIDNLTVLIDAVSLPYVQGATLDYQNGNYRFLAPENVPI